MLYNTNQTKNNYSSQKENLCENGYNDLMKLSFQRINSSLNNYGQGYTQLPKLNVNYNQK